MEELLENITELKKTMEKMSPEQLEQIPPTLLDTINFVIESLKRIHPSDELDRFLIDEIILINNLVRIAKSTTSLILLGVNGFRPN
jgi:hypothetical protein